LEENATLKRPAIIHWFPGEEKLSRNAHDQSPLESTAPEVPT
jgi:hypothetical protein